MPTNPGSKRPRSSSLFERAQSLFPGGVNSPVRAFKAVGGTPVFIDRGVGAYVFDVDGNRYLDFVGSWGPLILGHADPDVLAAIVARRRRRARRSAPRPSARSSSASWSASWSRRWRRCGCVSSGTEATMSALRARARLHRAAPHHQGRRRLPRPRRHAAGRGRLRRGDPGPPRLGRRHRRPPSPTPWSCRSTTSTRCARRSRRTATRSPR